MTIQNSLLSAVGFQFVLTRTPNIEYLVQEVSIPGMQLGSANVPTPFVRVVQAGNLTYDDLRVTFKISENLESYLEIVNWMEALGHPDDFDQYQDLRSDAKVIILNSAKRPSFEVTFTNIYPTSISNIDFDATLSDVQYINADATFAFDRMRFKTI